MLINFENASLKRRQKQAIEDVKSHCVANWFDSMFSFWIEPPDSIAPTPVLKRPVQQKMHEKQIKTHN